MTAAAHALRFGLGAGVCAVGGDTLPEITAAASSGGEEVRELFAGELQALQALRAAAAGDGGTWLAGKDTHTGLPTRYVAVGDSFLVAGVYVDESGSKALATGTSEPDDFTPVGFAYLTLVSPGPGTTTGPGASAGSRVTQLMTAAVAYAGTGLPELAWGEGLGSLVSTVVSASTRYLGAVAQAAIDGDATSLAGAAGSTADAAEAAAAAASGSRTIVGPGGMTVVADIGFEVGVSVSMVLQLVALAALLPLTLLAKQLSVWLRVYNASTSAIDVALCYLRPDNASVGVPGNTPVTLPPAGAAWTPPWIIGSRTVPYVNWLVGNTDQLRGVGLVLSLGSSGAGRPAAVVVDVPLDGPNGLGVVPDAAEDCGAVWTGANPASRLAVDATVGAVTLHVAVNALTGRSPSPVDGATGYDYEVVVLVQDAGQ